MNRSTPRAGRRSVPLLPLAGFGAFLAAASSVTRLPFSALAFLTVVLVAGVVGFVVMTVRRERRFNAAATARFDAAYTPQHAAPAEPRSTEVAR